MIHPTIPLQSRLEIRTKGLLLSLLYVLVCSLGIFLLFRNWAYDDPFITYRYAQNLREGIGFVYNAGERVLSTTTPLFALLLAPFAGSHALLPRIAVLLGALSLASGGLVLWLIARFWQEPVVGWTALLLYPTFPLLLTTLGSETPLYLALCLGTFCGYLYRRYALASLLAALAVLTRPDAVILAIILAGHFVLLRREAIPWKGPVILALILAVWALFAWSYFGSPIPVTLLAKQHQGTMEISQRFARGILTVVGWYSSWPYILEAAAAGIGIILVIWKKRIWFLFLAWPAIYFAAYAILGVSSYFWYYAPLVPGFIILIGLGLAGIQGLIERALGQGQAAGGMSLSWLVPLLLLGLFLFGQIRSIISVRRSLGNRAVVYRAIGEWLASNTNLDDQVAALEVGIIGYYAGRSMVDFAGLLQPEVARQLNEQTTYEDAAIWAASRYQPPYLILPAELFPRLESGYVEDNCELAKRFPGEKYSYPQDINIYFCGP